MSTILEVGEAVLEATREGVIDWEPVTIDICRAQVGSYSVFVSTISFYAYDIRGAMVSTVSPFSTRDERDGVTAALVEELWGLASECARHRSGDIALILDALEELGAD